MKKTKNIGQNSVFAGFALAVAVSTPSVLLAQELEEIVVTAQRREQSLQDVPISIETISGDDIISQGYTNLDELADFVPGMVMNSNVEEQSLIIRGQGTQTKNLVQESSVPIFIDGVSFSRVENVRATFLDIGRMEVLRGPQPVYFGQSARAGAVSVTTNKPTPEWEADVMLDLGNQTEKTIEVAAGGPITDTLGIRAAGRIDQADGFLRDVITDNLFPEKDYKVGRVSLQWDPMEKLTVLTKLDYSTQRAGADSFAISPRENVPTSSLLTFDPINYYAFGIPGVGFIPVAGEPGWTRRGVQSGPLYFAPLAAMTAPNGTSAAEQRKGILDMTRLRAGDLTDPVPRSRISFFSGTDYITQEDGVPVPEKYKQADFASDLESDLWNALLNVDYTLDNDIQITSVSAHTESDYQTTRGLASAFNTNDRNRYVDFNMWSQELRFTSPTGGKFEWIAGLYYQLNNVATSGNSWQASAVGPRGSVTSEDAEWRSVFTSVTYNFLGDKASLDVGARYSDIQKHGKGVNYQASWVVESVDNPGQLIALPRNFNLLDTRTTSGVPNYMHPVLGDMRRYHTRPIIGRTPLGITHILNADISEQDFDPQIVLRYRPTGDISAYLKWARATLAGSFEAGVAEITTVVGDFVLGPENAVIWEGGVRGSFLDGRLDASATIFRNDVSDLQVSGLDRVANRRRTVNAGSLRTQGLELGGRFQATDNWRVNLSTAFVMSEYLEFNNAVCGANLEALGLCNIEIDSNGVPQAVLDRTGQRGPDAPAYHIVLSTDYTIPFLENYQAVLNAQGSTIQIWTGDETLGTDVSDHREELNLAVTFGDIAENWELRFYGRNVLETRPPIIDDPDVIATDFSLRTTSLEPKDFGSYGVQFRYHFR